MDTRILLSFVVWDQVCYFIITEDIVLWLCIKCVEIRMITVVYIPTRPPIPPTVSFNSLYSVGADSLACLQLMLITADHPGCLDTVV